MSQNKPLCIYADANKFHINVEASFPENTDKVDDDRIYLKWFSPTAKSLTSNN